MLTYNDGGNIITIDIRELEKKANWVRNQVLDMVTSSNKGHIGGAFSCTDILVALYYGDILKFDASNPRWDGRDRFILSKGHSCSALYAILADLGFFSSIELNSFCGCTDVNTSGSMLGGHPDRNIPGIEANTGSLGHGLSIAVGIALRAKLDNKNYKTIVLLGDCECQEGSIWEAIMFAGHHKMNNLIAIVDYNKQCVTDFAKDVIYFEPFADKWKAFNWKVITVNGHSFNELLKVFDDLNLDSNDKPIVIIANTIKGKGVSFMEKSLEWHHAVPSGDNAKVARKELLKHD